MTDREMEDNSSGISYATWQDRQLAMILARTADLLRELRAGTASASRNEDLSRELGKAAALLELREAELRQAVDDAQFWQARSAALDRQLERQTSDEKELRARHRELQEIEKELRAGLQRLQNEVARLTAIESNYATETQILNARANASANETANLRRLAHDLQNSLSWKITAPLRFLTKPFFKAAAPKASLPAVTMPGPEIPRQEAAAAPAPVAEREPPFSTQLAGFVESLLPELRRAQSIAIIPCAIPFSSTLNQRPISCARYLADRGATVVYVAWQWFPDEPVPQPGEEVYPRVFHLPLYALLNHAESIALASHVKSTYFCTLPSPSLVELVRPLRAAGYHIHYDIMDDWEGFHRGGEAPWFSAPVEQEIVILADTVTAVSEKLVQKFDHLRSDIALVRNGYQPAAMGCEQFVSARTPLERPKVVGYFGHFSDAWFDWDAVIHAAKTLPDVQFELIGWAVSEPTRQKLAGLSNIRLPGIVPQKELHRYARKWWLGIIPFQSTQVSAAVDPLKIYEYLHLGLPSVVTGISGIAKFPLVRYAEGKDQFVEAIRQVTARPDEKRLGEVAEFLKECVWDERFARMVRVMGEVSGLASLYAR
jgi:glycosyltransferase involved in cell wall biosynthesis